MGENFNKDFMKLSKLIKIENVNKILHENQNKNKHKFDDLMVTPQFVQFINEFVSQDFERFGYRKVVLQKPMPLKQFKQFCSEKGKVKSSDAIVQVKEKQLTL